MLGGPSKLPPIFPAETPSADDSGVGGSLGADPQDDGATPAPAAAPAPTPLSPAQQSAADAESSKSVASFSAALSPSFSSNSKRK